MKSSENSSLSLTDEEQLLAADKQPKDGGVDPSKSVEPVPLTSPLFTSRHCSRSAWQSASARSREIGCGEDDKLR